MTIERNIHECEPHGQSVSRIGKVSATPYGQIFTAFGERLTSSISLTTHHFPTAIHIQVVNQATSAVITTSATARAVQVLVAS